MHRVTPLWLLIVLLLAPMDVRAQDELIRFEPTPDLTVYRSKHYRVFSNLSKREVLPYALHMDALFEQYERRFRSLTPTQVEPMPLYLFRNEQQYNRFLAEHDIDATHSGGMFFVTHQLEGLATWVEGPSRRKTLEVLQHEGFHQFAWHAFGPKLPVWLNEGLAQYFETAVLRDGHMSLGLSSRPRIEKVRKAIKAGKTIPLRTMTRITTEDWADTLRGDTDHSGLLYAQSWSLTYFMIHGEDGKHQPKLLDYLKRLSKGEGPSEAAFMAFGPKGLESMTKAWQGFALAQKPDDVTEATERLEFLGTGLRLLAEQGEDMPKDLGALRDTLRRYGFKLRRSEMGVTRSFSADWDELYRYDGGGEDQRAFVLIAPAQVGLPPRITAPGLEPEPTLIWYRDADGKLVQDIAYE